MRKFREGDRVSLMATVRHDFKDGDERVFLDVDGYYGHVSVPVEKAALVHPRIDVGERVRWRNGNEGEVIAAADGWLWVKGAKGRFTWSAVEVTVLGREERVAAEVPPIAPEPLPETLERED